MKKENFDWIKRQTWNRYMRHLDVSRYWLWLIVGFVAVGLLLWIFAQTETLSLIGQIAFYVGLGDIPVRFLYNEITEYSDLYAMMMLELIERQPVAGDRRKTRLVCTSKAEPLIAQGRVQQQKFALRLREGLTEADLEHFAQCMAILSHNIDAIKKEGI